MTLIFTRGYYLNSRLIHHPGDEVPPGLFSKEQVDSMLDARQLAEYDRPPLYRIFHKFTGCSEEQPLTKEQIARYALEE